MGVREKIWVIFIICVGALLSLGFFWGIDSFADRAMAAEKITVYASPSCGCCHSYIDYLRENGFDADVIHTDNVAGVKKQYNIPQNLLSCHTAITSSGYIIEGHVPAESIKKLLRDKPNVRGIALPGMPKNAPGMGDGKGPFEVVIIP